jgi:hypothetical protein
MMTPTTAELLNAIEVLKRLGERINTNAVHSAMQLSETSLGNNFSGKLNVQAIEQTTRIETVAEQLTNWREELLQQRRQNVSQSV